jgi:adenylate cyclase class 2
LCPARADEYSDWLMTGTLEREIKLRFESGAAARQAIASSGARLLRPRRLQSDALLDRDGAPLRGAGCVLRVRIEEDRAFLTFKGAPQLSTMKVREELESGVADGPLVIGVFERLGYSVWFRYEKYREEFALDDVTIAIDDTPIGTFVEIEGPAAGIEAAAAALGRGPSDYVVLSYRALFLQYCDERGIEPSHMLYGTV